ncbi:MAG: hypothetical protein KDK28_03275 [Maritimibacter sp.]|nr:hypothetical protein [Maritimibacter sp.]
MRDTRKFAQFAHKFARPEKTEPWASMQVLPAFPRISGGGSVFRSQLGGLIALQLGYAAALLSSWDGAGKNEARLAYSAPPARAVNARLTGYLRLLK